MTHYFQFEEDFVTSLRCIPMIVRYKLDTCGIKLKLNHWHQFSQQERQILVEQSFATPAEVQTYREYLKQLVINYTNSPVGELPIEENPAWMNAENLPEMVEKKAQEFDIKLALDQWQKLTPIQRFVLIKLSRPSHENKNFLPALKEFNLLNE